MTKELNPIFNISRGKTWKQRNWKNTLYVFVFFMCIFFFYNQLRDQLFKVKFPRIRSHPVQFNDKSEYDLSESYFQIEKKYAFWKITWTRRHLLELFGTFKRKFAIFENEGGMRLPHQFAVFAVLNILKPKCIIESGVWHGATTKLIHKVLPDSQIISIDPLCFKLISKKHSAICGPNFRDFKDLGTIFHGVNRNTTLVIFDDHQSGFARVLQAHRFGFKYVIVEDNYPFGFGDNYSPKHVLTDTNSEVVLYLDNFGKVRKNLTKKQHYKNRNLFKSVVETYVEFPPLNKNMTVKWLAQSYGDTSGNYLSNITTSGLELDVPFKKDYLQYTFISFMELVHNADNV